MADELQRVTVDLKDGPGARAPRWLVWPDADSWTPGTSWWFERTYSLTGPNLLTVGWAGRWIARAKHRGGDDGETDDHR